MCQMVLNVIQYLNSNWKMYQNTYNAAEYDAEIFIIITCQRFNANTNWTIFLKLKLGTMPWFKKNRVDKTGIICSKIVIKPYGFYWKLWWQILTLGYSLCNRHQGAILGLTIFYVQIKN